MSEQAVIDAIASYMETAPLHRFNPENPQIKLHEPTFGAEEITAATLAMLEGRITMGNACRTLEQRFAASTDCSEAMLVNSGSSANLLAVSTLTNADYPNHLVTGDEVIVSALSWSTTVWPLVQRGLVPVIVDIDHKTLNIDPGAVRAAIGPRTRAVMPVHVYGNPCDMSALSDICQQHDLFLIEDCCEALGASYDDQPVGSFGVAGTFSLYFSHHITTLEGGVVVTGDSDFAELSRVIRAHGWTRDMKNPEQARNRHGDIDAKFLFVNEGYNFRLSEPQAEFGLIQLRKLEDFVERRRRTAHLLKDRFHGFADVIAVQSEQDNGRHSWFGFPMVLVKDDAAGAGILRAKLAEAGIESRPIICGNIASQPAMHRFNHRVAGSLAHADHVMRNGFAIPCHQSMDEEQANYVADSMTRILERSAG